MALFKIFKGPEEELANVPCHEGYAYFTEDLGNLYIDIGNGQPEQDRIQVNADAATKLIKLQDNEIAGTINFDDILLKTAIQDVSHGGTGLETVPVNNLLLGNGTSKLKVISVENNALVVGDSANGIKSVTGNGVLTKAANGAPTFTTILSLAMGGTGANNAGTARTNLDVYSKTETDNAITNATTHSFTATLAAASWVDGSGDTSTYTLSTPDLKCGKTGDVPPIITFTENKDEYSKIESAVATPNTNIIFTIKKTNKLKAAIGLLITDNM